MVSRCNETCHSASEHELLDLRLQCVFIMSYWFCKVIPTPPPSVLSHPYLKGFEDAETFPSTNAVFPSISTYE